LTKLVDAVIIDEEIRALAQFGSAFRLGRKGQRFKSFMPDLQKLTLLKMDQEFNQLQSFTVEEFQKDFDTLLNRVENGESFLIKSEHGNAVMIPYNEVVQILEESGVSEDIIRIHTDHEEGS
jgi:hypothetical protein